MNDPRNSSRWRGDVYERPSAYGDGPYEFSRAFVEDGKRYDVAGPGSRPLRVPCPLRILHGTADEVTPSPT